MSDVALRMEHVYKKFRKGEIYNSLRDLIPALTGGMFRQQELSSDDKREFWALQDVSLEIKHGEAFGIIGDNGAGKSTMLKILSRIMKPTKGRMIVNGRLSALLEVSAGFHLDLTGRENIFLNGTILGMNKREIESRLDQIIAFSGLEDFIDTPVKRYSSGMYARLGFSVAAHVNPEVLLVDEVLSVGDYAFQNRCVERMKEVIRGGATVLFVSHNLKTVAEFCDRCLLMEHGSGVATGPTQTVVSTYISRSQSGESVDANSKSVLISKVKFRNEQGECIRFESGEKGWVDVEVTGRAPSSKLAVEFAVTDDHYRVVFNTSTERLGHGNFNLDAGDVFTCTFELNWNMNAGIYHPSIYVYRYDSQTLYDKRGHAATIYISSDLSISGPVNCFPKITKRELRAA